MFIQKEIYIKEYLSVQWFCLYDNICKRAFHFCLCSCNYPFIDLQFYSCMLLLQLKQPQIMTKEWVVNHSCQSGLLHLWKLRGIQKTVFHLFLCSVLNNISVWGPWFPIFMGIPCYCLNHLRNLGHQSIIGNILTMAIKS